MDFSSEGDVDMMHDGDMLGGAGGMQFGHHQQHHVQQQQAHHSQQQAQLAMGGLVIDTQQGGFGGNPFGATMIPGLAPGALQPPQQQQQPQGGAFPSSVEEYAALMGIKLEGPAEEMSPSTPMAHMSPAAVNGNAFNLQPAPDMAKIQANTDYFDNLYRRASSELDVSGGATSMTLPAGIGSGMSTANMFVGGGGGGGNGGGIPGVVPASSPLYDRTSELAFGEMNRMYDPSSGYSGAPVPMHKPNMMVLDKFAPRGMMHHEPLGSQTLSPEMLSAMIKSNNGHSFSDLNEDEQQAILKEEKSRERNRDHSRKSRLRKKVFVESLKHEVDQLQIYQQICEQCLDLIALVSQDAIFMYSSAAYSRVLGYQGHQIIAGQTSFLDLVHPENVQEVRSVFQKFTALNETRKFQFRIKSVEGEYFRAETAACMTDKGVVCSTRVDRDI